MEYENLLKAADEAIISVNHLIKIYGELPSLIAIKNQMVFVRDHALNKTDPVKKLGSDDEFTYGTISSREFSSPEEMKVKEKLNNVSDALKSIWNEST